MSTGTTETLLDRLEQFLTDYYKSEVSELARLYPNDSQSLWIDYSDLYQYDPDIAYDLQQQPEEILDKLEEALALVDQPIDVDLSNAKVRVTGLTDSHIHAPGEIRNEHGGTYVGISGVLERVTSTADMVEEAVFECQRCPGQEIPIEQTLSTANLQEPYQCPSCERQGPFELNHAESTWSDYAKLRIESRPDEDEADSGKVVGFALNDLIDEGGDTGLIGRAGEPVTVYGVLKRQQKTGRNENELLFDHIIDARAIEFEKDAETVDIEEHRDNFEALANQPDAVDKFASSIAPQLHETDAWETAMEFAVAYLFGAPRIDLPNGPTYRGDLHFLIVSDYGMGKSTFKEEIESYSPKCISKSTTALSSGVGLTAAAVKDDFGEGQWTIKPGLLVRSNGGHLLLDEIDKGPDELTEMNDAIEGEQVVDIEKAGKSATYDSKCGVMALGNPVDGRFDPHESISAQLDMSETLLSRFDGIVTMRDSEDEDTDKKVAQTFGKAYTEAQQAAHGDEAEFDTLERQVPIDVGQAWIKHAREEVHPVLSYEQFQELEDWYAEDVRQLNGGDEDMPVPATVRVLAAAVKMSIAFARVHLRETVTEPDIERAKKLSKKLIKQHWDGEKFDATKNHKSQNSRRPAVYNLIAELEQQYDEGVPEEHVVDTADDDPGTVMNDIEQLKQKGELYTPQKGHLRTT